MVTANKVYNAHAKQTQFHNAVRLHDYVLFNGGRGSGKTTAGAIQSIMEAMHYQPGSRGIVTAPTYPMLEDATMKELFDWLPRHWISEYQKQRKLLTLTNGSEIAFRSLDDPESARGPNRAWAWFDEPRNLKTRAGFDIVSAQLRPTRKMWLTTTPSGVFHWLYELFIKSPLPNSKVITVRTSENPYVPPDFSENLRIQYTGTFAAQELDAEWVSFEGRVYDEFSTTENVSEDAEYRPGLRTIWGCDDGYAIGDGLGKESYHPRVVLVIQVTEQGGVNVVNEYYRTGVTDYNTTIDDVLAFNYDFPDVAYVDSSAAMFRGALNNRGIGTSRATHTVVEGIKNLRRLVCDGNGVRLLKIHPRCTNLIYEMNAYRNNPDVQATGGELKPMKVDDHGPDALRYATYHLRWNI